MYHMMGDDMISYPVTRYDGRSMNAACDRILHQCALGHHLGSMVSIEGQSVWVHEGHPDHDRGHWGSHTHLGGCHIEE